MPLRPKSSEEIQESTKILAKNKNIIADTNTVKTEQLGVKHYNGKKRHAPKTKNSSCQ